jgi:hypothetical protein
MSVLFVIPSEVSSGEAITAHHMARDVVLHGGEVRFLATRLTAGFLTEPFADRVTELTNDLAGNKAAWDRVIREVRPHVVVFADYPLLFFPSGSAPLADDAWVHGLGDLDAGLVTLDHLGYAQRPMTVYFGPPHLSLHSATTPLLPNRMHVTLPCPVHEPGQVVGRTGTPFRSWFRPSSWTEDEVQRVRRTYLRDERDYLIVHSAPGWAWRTAEIWGLPYYQFLPSLMGYNLAHLPRPALIVSVNNGHLLPPSDDGRVRILNLAAMPSAEYERLLLACDLMLTENAVSVSLGKAVGGLRPAAVLRNSHRLVDLLAQVDQPLRRAIIEMESTRLGAIFPYDVFPIWGRHELDQLGLYRDNTFVDTFAWVEVFGGEPTRRTLHDLLVDEGTRDEMRTKQEAYVRELATLSGPHEIVRHFAGG